MSPPAIAARAEFLRRSAANEEDGEDAMARGNEKEVLREVKLGRPPTNGSEIVSTKPLKRMFVSGE
jgi:hypothetical protein